MNKFLFRRPSPAMVIACVALTISLTGVSYAAVTLANNSVGTRHLKPKAVVGSKVAGNTIRGKHVLESSLGKVPNADKLDGEERGTRIRVFSCAGGAFVPEYTPTEWATLNLTKYIDGITGGAAASCAVDLPNGARIVGFTASLVDAHDDGRITDVQLLRVGQSGAVRGDLDSLAQITPASNNALTPGGYDATDNSIANDVVDNALFAYAVRVSVLTTSSQPFQLGIRGARITYYMTDFPTVTPAP